MEDNLQRAMEETIKKTIEEALKEVKESVSKELKEFKENFQKKIDLLNERLDALEIEEGSDIRERVKVLEKKAKDNETDIEFIAGKYGVHAVNLNRLNKAQE
ncbi:hypothetical protein ABEX78_21720 [Priestia megaterium]